MSESRVIISKPRLIIIGVFGVLIGATLAMSFPWEVPRDNLQTARTAVSGRSGSLEVRGGIDTNRLVCPRTGACPDLKIWYVFQNRSSLKIPRVHIVALHAPGFPYDQKDVDVAALFGLTADLKPQEATGVEAILHPVAGAGRYNIELVYAWASPGGGDLRGTISLGPVEVSTWWERSIYNSARRVKDLGLPLVLLWAGWLLQKNQKERDDKQQREQKLREEQQVSAQKARDDRRVVLTTLLPTHVKDTKTYYLPFASGAQVLIERIHGVQAHGNAVAASPLRKDELWCVYAYFMLLKRHRFVVQEIGGIQFSNHRGETVLALALGRFLGEARQYRVPQDVQDRVLKSMTLTQDFGEFLDVLEAEGTDGTDDTRPLTAGTQAVAAWIRDPFEPLSKMIPLLTILKEVLLYEMDLPMELWYEERRELPDLDAAVAELPQLAQRHPGDTVQRIPKIEDKFRAFVEGLTEQLAAYQKENAARQATVIPK